MDRVGVRQLQQNAAITVERVRLGESIEVTVRGRPVAKLVPVIGGLLDQLEASGRLKRGKGDLLDLGPPLKPRRGRRLRRNKWATSTIIPARLLLPRITAA